MTARLLATLLFVVCLGLPAQGLGQSDLMPGPTATIASVVDGDTVVLKTPVLGASQIRLVGIQAPKLTLGRKNFPTWPLAAAAKSLLEALVDGKPLTLSFGGANKDRHGRLLAHLHRPDGTWIQGEMLKRGIWGLRYYAIRGADPVKELSRLAGSFQLIEGRVTDAVRIKGQIYLNFGQDWRSDFTITLKAKVARQFAKAGVDPLSLKGRMARVRGGLKKYNGPMVEASHPEQIEVITL